ncbi:MAG TPA: demethylmenaquinone methyltransferase [Bacilli bacterium]
MEAKSKEQYVHSVFESIAGKYDLMNDVISFRRHKAWRKFAMKRMNVLPGQSAIDVCCGTCDWTISLAKASGNGQIVGLDFSENMLNVGRRKIAESGLNTRIELVNGNAMALPFPDDSFDFATIGFGLRNTPDIVRTLREMARVVKPGGKVVCLELSKPTMQPFKAVYYLYFRHLLPLLGKLVAKRYEQYKWLPQSLLDFPDYRKLAEMFRTEAGLTNVEVYPLYLGIAAVHIGTKKE